MTPIPYDAHIHTRVGRGQDSTAELIRAAEAAQLELAVLCDSYESGADEVRETVQQTVRADAETPVQIVPGLEVTARNAQGFIDLPEGHARLYRVVYGALGARTDGIAVDPPADKNRYIANIFRAMFAMVERRTITAIARPFNIGQFPAPLSPSQLPQSGLEDLAEAMEERDIAFEISNQMHWWFPELTLAEFTVEYADLIGIFGDRNVKFIVGSDATCGGSVGNLGYVRHLMQQARIEKSQVVDLPKLVSRQRAGD